MSEDNQIKIYGFDNGYFDIDQQSTINIIKFNGEAYVVQDGVIDTVAEILAEKTIAISKIREDLKIQT